MTLRVEIIGMASVRLLRFGSLGLVGIALLVPA